MTSLRQVDLRESDVPLAEPGDDERYHRGWERWVASNLMRGVTPRAITSPIMLNDTKPSGRMVTRSFMSEL